MGHLQLEIHKEKIQFFLFLVISNQADSFDGIRYKQLWNKIWHSTIKGKERDGRKYYNI